METSREKKLKNNGKIPSSFRDPSGFLFYKDGVLYRQVNASYKENYDHLINSGLYKTLVDAELLIPHEEVDIESIEPDRLHKIISPQLIPFVSYPYEWCFSQLKDAALTTLRIQKIALKFGMSLKDSSAFNIQFRNGKPILIDTLSFERYQEGSPWIAYRQFCQHFLAPLSLMSKKDIRLNQLFRIYLDGIPLDLTSSILPFSSFFKFSLLLHIHIHAKSQSYFARKSIIMDKHKVSLNSLMGLIDNLESTVYKLKYKPNGTEWGDYYNMDINYTSDAFQHKKQIVDQFLERINSKNVWDFGANVGIFSRIASDKRIPTLSFDIDPAAVEKNYLGCKAKKDTKVLPLIMDLANPSPGTGWGNGERSSLIERGPTDLVLALALVHHLSISNNVPFSEMARFFSSICRFLVIEFVPKEDSQVKRLLMTRKDIFLDYNRENFEKVFLDYFVIEERIPVRQTQRILYLMKKRLPS